MTSLTAIPPLSASRSNRGSDPYDGIEPWLEKMASLPEHSPERAALREEIVGRCLSLAEHIARRYTRRGESYDDLYQVASLGLLLSIDRFDPVRGTPFVAFAVPTIMGEVRRHFRDRTWALRVPRAVKLLQADIGPAVERLAQRGHRMPTVSELAAELEVDRLDVTQALLAANAFSTETIDNSPDDSGRVPAATRAAAELGTEDDGYHLTEDALAVAPLLRELPARERDVLRMRFFEDQTQHQIAERLGVSQMQVSRILTRTLATLREQALADRR
ncbi:SigB/SigF/SigG family RNA polymerase sigma factor [Nocardia alni]|uniref:SigB/SigF/SigG family RNA polymerase sigma factor n=1 Tax=Nocardia alni TaxID=2815723 RepID=UPI001C22568A|nr:SigB/SigF/SigG family RNA polymerase sigma factor [Nocardia alni]